MYTDKIKRMSSDIIKKIISIRRDLHMHPELGFNEHRTASIISDHLEKLGLKVCRNIAGTGVTGLIEGKNPGKTIAIRADMDALPIQEQNKVEYASTNNGIMHACGHDAHVSIALGAAEILSNFRDTLNGNIKFIFQPAEEGLGGAKFMINEGVLENPSVDRIIALHVSPGLGTGVVSVGEGPVMASPSEFEIVIKGKGGHAAEPHKSIDPIIIGSNIVNMFQTIVPKKLGPLKKALLSVTCFQAGNTFNITPAEATIKGTVRTYEPNADDLISDSMKTIVSSVCSSMGADFLFNYVKSYPPVINDSLVVRQIIEAAGKITGTDNIVINPEPSMLAEDFSYYVQIVPGALFNLGCTKPPVNIYHNLHCPRFDIDEACISTGMEIMSQCALDFLLD